MAEYIDRVEAMNIIAGGKNDKAYFGTINKDWEVIDFLKDVPTADVIEREKIDKAIEVITTLRDSTNRMITGETSLANECYKQYVNCFDECLRIIKQNTGVGE